MDRGLRILQAWSLEQLGRRYHCGHSQKCCMGYTKREMLANNDDNQVVGARQTEEVASRLAGAWYSKLGLRVM
jgi:hypothetical protein